MSKPDSRVDDWPEYRLLVLGKLEDIQRTQQNLTDDMKNQAAKIASEFNKIFDNYAALKMEVVREAARHAGRNAFLAACIPTFVSICTMIVTLIVKFS